MPEFSACYFCGTALDAPLSEYPVVPKALHPSADQQRTVVLCPTCRRKLGAVVDTVIQAVDDAPDTDSIQQELAESSGEGVTSDAESDGISVERLDTEETASDESSSEVLDPSSTPAEPSTDDDPDSEFESADAEPADDTADEAATDAEKAPQDESESESAATDDEDETASDPLEAAGQSASASADDAGAADEPATEADDEEPQMTALEYNKVMRLLQNREFPVDKAEFKVVATNAYDIEDDEFETVIEAAAKRDLIAVENGQIVDGE